MGVKGLWSLLNPVARPVQIESLEGKRLAIDSSIWLYQFQSTMRDKDGRVLTNAHVLGFLRRINKLLFHGIKPVFVFDGGAPALKRSTIAERKRKKAGAAFNAAKMAEKLLQAQMRREALRLAQQGEATRAARDAEAAYVEEGGESIPANAVYLDQLEGGSGSVGGSTGRAPPVPEEEDELAAKRKRRDKHLKKDRYYLPEATVPSYSTEEKPDARLATEEELRQFIDDVHPEDIDVESAEFRALPTEVQYEIIGDLRIKSRQQSHKRLTDMLAGAPTALDFSKAQIKHLGQRNALTQQLLTVTDMVGKAHLTIPVRVAAERNRQYLLVKRDDGGGWALGIREGTKDRPIVLEPETEADRVKKEHEEVESGSESDFDSSSDIEEYKPPPDDDLRKHRRAETLEAIARRYAPATSKRSLDVAITPFGRARAPGAQPLFDSAEEPEDAAPVVTANDEALALALQKEELGEDEDEADPELARALALSRREAAEREQEQEPAKPADLALPSDEEDEFEEVALVPSRSLTPGNVSVGHDEPIVVGDSESEDDLVEVVPQPPEVPISELSDERGPRASAAASRSASRTANLVAQSRPQPQPKAPQPQTQAPSKPQPQFQPTLRLEASSDDDEFEEVPTPTVTSESPAGFVPKPARAPPAPRPNLSKLVQMSRPKSPEPQSSPEPDLEPMQEPSPEVDVQDQRSPSYEPPRRGAPSPSPGPEEGPFDSLRRAPSPSPGPDEGPFDTLCRAPSPSPPPASDDGPLAGLRRAPSPSPPPFETPASLLEPEQTIQDESARDEPAEETAEPTLQDAPARSRRYDYDSDEDEPIEWSRSPTPQPRAQNEAVSALRRTSTAISLASEPDGDDEDEMAPADMVAEEDDYARFLAQIKNRDLNEVRGEIDDEIRVLNAQKQAAQRDSDEITHSMVVQIQTLLRHFGIPYITAPMEAEAQCAKLAELGLVDGIITDDSDVFLFGGTQCFKNIFNDAKFAECFLATDIERELSLTRERLVSLSYLLGSDYTLGLPGVGPVLALELLANFPGPDGLVHFRDWWLKVQAGTDTEDEADTKWKKSFKKRFADTLQLNHSWPDPHVREAYLYPTADESDEPFHWGFPRLAALRTFLHEELSWSISKVDDELTPIVQRIAKRGKGQLNTQGTLLPFFDNSAGAGVSYAPRRRTTANMSKRLMSVIKQFREAEAAAKGQEGVEWGEMLAGVDESDPKGRKRADESDAGKAKASAKGKAPAKGKGKAPAKPKTKKAAPKRKRTSKSKSTTQSDDEEEDEDDPEVEVPPKRAKRRTSTRSASAAGRSTRGSTLEA